MLHTEKMRMFVRPDEDLTNGMKFMLVNEDHTYYMNDSDIKLEEVEVTCTVLTDLSEDELRLKAIQTLKDKQERARAEAEQRCVRLQKKIDQMLLLTHQPDIAVVA